MVSHDISSWRPSNDSFAEGIGFFVSPLSVLFWTQNKNISTVKSGKPVDLGFSALRTQKKASYRVKLYKGSVESLVHFFDQLLFLTPSNYLMLFKS